MVFFQGPEDYGVPPKNVTGDMEEQSGRLLEREFFGPSCEPSSKREKPPHLHFGAALHEAIRKVEGAGVWNTQKPNTDLALLLYEQVLRGLKSVGLMGVIRRLKLYPAIGTSLDMWHGTDGVLVAEGLFQSWYVLFDVSLRHKSKRRRNPSKANHLLIRFKDLDDSLAVILKSSRKIVRMFQDLIGHPLKPRKRRVVTGH